MILHRNYIHTDSQRKEFLEDGLELFDLTANDNDIHQFVAGCISVHWHAELEIFILRQGRVQVDIGSSQYELTAGEGCFINTGVLHSFQALETGACTFRSFVFDAGIVSGMPGSVFDIKYVRPLLQSGIPFLKLHPDRGDERFFSEFQAAFDACEQEAPQYEFEVREILSKILMHIKGKTMAESSRQFPSVQEGRLKQMLEWIDNHIEKPIRLDDLAASANICPRECQRIFSTYLHCSPMEYLRRRRLYFAADLLCRTDAPVTDIALRCGFSSPSYFSNQFKLLVGKTPTEYRDIRSQEEDVNQLSALQ